MNKFRLAFAILFFPGLAFAQAGEIFPQQLDANNTIVKFEVDSTWHLIQGIAEEVSGKVWLGNEDDFGSIQADISFPAKKLDTDNSMRDERLREVMAAEKFTNVRFRVLGVTKPCKLDELRSDVECDSNINGKLTIRDITTELSIPVRVIKKDEQFLISGKTSIEWADYGVEDPSIFIAKLDKTVAISFEVFLADKPTGGEQ